MRAGEKLHRKPGAKPKGERHPSAQDQRDLEEALQNVTQAIVVIASSAGQHGQGRSHKERRQSDQYLEDAERYGVVAELRFAREKGGHHDCDL